MTASDASSEEPRSEPAPEDSITPEPLAEAPAPDPEAEAPAPDPEAEAPAPDPESVTWSPEADPRAWFDPVAHQWQWRPEHVAELRARRHHDRTPEEKRIVSFANGGDFRVPNAHRLAPPASKLASTLTIQPPEPISAKSGTPRDRIILSAPSSPGPNHLHTE